MKQMRIHIQYEKNDFKREVTEMASAFFSAYELDFEEVENKRLDEKKANSSFINSELAFSELAFSISIEAEGVSRKFEIPKNKLEEENYLAGRRIKRGIYMLFSEFTGKQLPWGTMTGIRPVKLYRKLYEENPETAESRLMEEYFVMKEKIEVLKRIFQLENKYLSETPSEEISIYVGIPFCPSRCSYCSFSSVKAKQDRSDVKEYLEHLLEEIRETGERMKGKKIQSIYIGGGTPGILEPTEIQSLFAVLKKVFLNVEEITFEGGRPDVLNKEKLLAAYSSGATRISINPQTMNDSVLASLNRSHGIKEVKKVYAEARAIGFENINMDLILGLPGETWQSFLSSLDSVIELNPESITIHALALKKASEFMLSGLKHLEAEKPDISELIQNRLRTAGYNPYYLYRQKNTYMNLENVGYAKDGFESVFNIQSMADKQSCIAFGADAVSKFVTGQGLVRLHNPKFPEEYNKKIKELIEKKGAFL